LKDPNAGKIGKGCSQNTMKHTKRCEQEKDEEKKKGYLLQKR
jgi:hypothetical protein